MSEKQEINFVSWSELAVAQILDNANISHRQLLMKLHAIKFDEKSIKKLAANKSVEHFISLLLVVETLKAQLANKTNELANKTNELFKEIDELRESYDEMTKGYEQKIKLLKKRVK